MHEELDRVVGRDDECADHKDESHRLLISSKKKGMNREISAGTWSTYQEGGLVVVVVIGNRSTEGCKGTAEL